jgi:hypothetical protein
MCDVIFGGSTNGGGHLPGSRVREDAGELHPAHGAPIVFPTAPPATRYAWTSKPERTGIRDTIVGWTERHHLTEEQTQLLMVAIADEQANFRTGEEVYVSEATDPNGLPQDAAHDEFIAIATGRDARGALAARVAEFTGADVASSWDAEFGHLASVILSDEIVSPIVATR